MIRRLVARATIAVARFTRRREYLSRQQQLIRDGLLVIGRHTYGSPLIDVYQGSESRVLIGSFCSISRDVVFVAGGIHPVDWVSTYPFRIRWQMGGAYEDGMPATRGDIVIGSDVWIGTEAMIFSGVTVGHGAVIAARAVVTRDVAPYAVVAGMPARTIRYRFDPETIGRLLQMRWWEWDDDRIREAVPLLANSNAKAFLARYTPQGVPSA